MEARGAELGRVRALRLVGCHPGCDRPAPLLRLRELGRRYGQLQLRAVLKQLRCTHCKRPTATVEIADHIVDNELSTFRIRLLP